MPLWEDNGQGDEYMKKLLAPALVVIALIVGISMLTSCTRVENTNQIKDNTSMFVIVESTAQWKVLYHKKTKVMYAVSSGSYNNGSFTLLVNADGTPMYTRRTKFYEE